MKSFDWNLFKDKRNNRIAVRCKTKEEAKDFCLRMHEQGLKWCSGRSYLRRNCWDEYKEKTCYSNRGEFSPIDYYKHDGYTVFEYSDYFDNDRVESIEEFILRTKRNVEF